MRVVLWPSLLLGILFILLPTHGRGSVASVVVKKPPTTGFVSPDRRIIYRWTMYVGEYRLFYLGGSSDYYTIVKNTCDGFSIAHVNYFNYGEYYVKAYGNGYCHTFFKGFFPSDEPVALRIRVRGSRSSIVREPQNGHAMTFWMPTSGYSQDVTVWKPDRF